MTHPFVWQNDSFYFSVFADALRREGEAEGQRLQRFYPLLQAFRATQDLDGETAEAGCLFGLASLLFCRYEQALRPDYRGATHHVFDSFIGLSFPDPQDLQTELHNPWIDALQEERKTSTGAIPQGDSFLERTRAVLADFSEIDFNVGWIPEVFASVPTRRYRFVHVDVDLYAPVKASLEFFYPQLLPGGLIVIDDYGFTNWPGVREATDEFAAAHGAPVISLTTGNAIMMKRA